MEVSEEARQQRLRVWYSPKELDLADFVGIVRVQQGLQDLDDNHPTTVSRGACVKWHSPETDEEYESRQEHTRRHSAREEEWERKTYERLKEKFG